MSYNTPKPIKRTQRVLSTLADHDDYYVYVPFRRKDSIDYRNYVKSIYGRFDPFSLRWYIPNIYMNLKVKDELNNLNMFDGYRFVYHKSFNEMFDPSQRYKQLLDIRQNSPNTKYRTMCFNIGPNNSVHFTFVDSASSGPVYYAIISYSKSVIKDEHSFNAALIDNRTILPVQYAREEWKYYASSTDSKSIVSLGNSAATKIFSVTGSMV
jgi:hypothetical protein